MGGEKGDLIAQEQIAPRQKMSDSLSKLSRPPRANLLTIKGKKERNDSAEKELNEVTTGLIEYNRRDFKIDSLKLRDGTLRPVLPYSENVWKNNVLVIPYRQSYSDRLNALLKKLNPTQIPTASAIEREAASLQIRLDREREKKTKEERSAAAEKDVRVGMGPAIRNPGAGLRGAKRSTGSSSAEAYRQAADKVKFIAAQRGQIYATKSSFDVLLTDMHDPNLTADELWKSQVNLWVQQDIVDTLIKTNDEVQDSMKIPDADRCVINSAVKRLVKIEIFGQGTSEVKKRDTGYGAGMAGPPMMGGPGMPGGMPQRPAKNKKRSKREANVKRADSLTGNTSDKMMDVVNYSFTVIISTRHLPVLEKKLLEQNFHFILEEEIMTQPSYAGVPANASGGYTKEELSYYGVEPVSRVTIEGQLALLADWTRGEYDTKTKTWTTTPLMPVSVMEQLPPAAQRKQDKDLISGKLLRPWDPGFVQKKSSDRSRRGRGGR
ncbi:MAG: hypothetical protein KAR11_00715 [Phycisphaerae bacterium]|nr:hypothetical protein [Phycisphaerae bacterium]